MERQLKPRTPSGYDNAIHGRKDYDSPLSDDEPEKEVVARTRVWDFIAILPEPVKRNFLLALRPARVLPTTTQDSASPTATRDKTIWYHGGNSYSVDDPKGNPLAVSDAEHSVLQLFLDKKFAMTRVQIEAALSLTNAPQLMGQLVERYNGLFAMAIVRPGRKGRGGYFVRVERFAQHAQ